METKIHRLRNGSGKMTILCILCGTELKGLYCTYDVCKDCCTHMKCPIRYTCKAYPKVLEEEVKRLKMAVDLLLYI